MKALLPWGIVMAAFFLVPAAASGQGIDFTGTIGESLGIAMTLHFYDGTVIGLYHYKKCEDSQRVAPVLRLKGTMDDARRFTLSESDSSGRCTGRFEGAFVSDRALEGEWSSPDGDRTYPFRAATRDSVDEQVLAGLTRLQVSGFDAARIFATPDVFKNL